MLNQVSVVLSIGIPFTTFECLLDQKTLLCLFQKVTTQNIWISSAGESLRWKPEASPLPSKAPHPKQEEKRKVPKKSPSFPKEGFEGTFVPEDGQRIVPGTESGPIRALQSLDLSVQAPLFVLF